MKKDKSKKILPVNLSDLIDAFESGSVENRYFIDLETGEIIYINDYFTDEELKKEIEEGFETRYIEIPYIETEIKYQDMLDFVDTVKDANLKEKLYIALDGKGAFRRFKDVLLNYPRERERWFKFSNEKMEERVLEWLESENYEIKDTLRHKKQN